MDQQGQNNDNVGEAKNAESKKRGQKPMPTDIEDRMNKLEMSVEKILARINISDEPVKPPQKKNYNPDFLPTGGPPVGLDDLPKKQL